MSVCCAVAGLWRTQHAQADSSCVQPQRSHRATAPPLPPASQQELSQLLEMGFDAPSATRALQLSNNNIEVALSHLT